MTRLICFDPRFPSVAPDGHAALVIPTTETGYALASASGFILWRDGRPFLLTNLHVVSGRHFEDGKVLSRDGATPAKVAITFAGCAAHQVAVDLFDSDERGVWLEHPSRRSDVVAIPMNAEFAPPPVESQFPDPGALGLEDYQLLVRRVGDVIIAGYPFGLREDSGGPIWTRGMVSTDPETDYNNRQAFLIDSRTRIGQSGSMVIAQASGLWPHDPDGEIIVDDRITLVRFMGIYSGRVHNDSDLGYVWNWSCIADIIDGGKRTDRDVHGNIAISAG